MTRAGSKIEQGNESNKAYNVSEVNVMVHPDASNGNNNNSNNVNK